MRMMCVCVCVRVNPIRSTPNEAIHSWWSMTLIRNESGFYLVEKMMGGAVMMMIMMCEDVDVDVDDDDLIPCTMCERVGCVCNLSAPPLLVIQWLRTCTGVCRDFDCLILFMAVAIIKTLS